MAEVRRDLYRTSGLRLLKAGENSRVPKSVPRQFLEISKEEIPQPLGSKCQYTITCTAQNCCLVLRGNLLCSTLCSLTHRGAGHL